MSIVSNLSLKSRFIILLVVPLVFQLIIGAGLWVLFSQAESKARSIAHSKDILVSLGLFSFSFLDASGRLLSASIDTRARDASIYIQSDFAKCNSCLAAFRRTVASDRRASGALPKLQAALSGLVRLQDQARLVPANDSAGNRWQSVGMVRGHLIRLCGELKAGLEQATAEEQLFESRESEVGRSLNAAIQVLLAVLVVAGIALTIVLGLVFASDTLKQLAVLEENALRIGLKRELLPPLVGAGEISFIDRSLHSACDQLSYNALERQRIMSMLSHDLRTPLLVLKGSLALLLAGADGALTAAARERIEAAEQCADTVVALTEQILNIEQEERNNVKFAVVKLGQIIDDCLPAVEPCAQARQVNIVCHDRDVTVKADLPSINRVLTNLLSNAIKFSPSGAAVVVSAAGVADRVKIDVKDSGVGIDKEELDYVFEPFYQTSSGRQYRYGSGLGLSICRELVALNGGAISVRSEKGVGSVFSVLLPQAPVLR